MKIARQKKKKFAVYEHLEHDLKNTNYSHRLQWLQEINEFFYFLEKKKIIPRLSK